MRKLKVAEPVKDKRRIVQADCLVQSKAVVGSTKRIVEINGSSKSMVQMLAVWSSAKLNN
jgi:hypothetical protein